MYICIYTYVHTSTYIYIYIGIHVQPLGSLTCGAEVRDMASALRLEVDSRRRKVDEAPFGGPGEWVGVGGGGWGWVGRVPVIKGKYAAATFGCLSQSRSLVGRLQRESNRHQEGPQV